MLSGWGPESRHRAEAGSVSTQPRPLLPRLCGEDPACGQTAGAGGAAGGMRPRPGAHTPPPGCGSGAPRRREGRSQHTRYPEPCKELGTGA